jgi:antitoxin CptB
VRARAPLTLEVRRHCLVTVRGGQPLESHFMDTLVDTRTLSKLKWRCRRGLLENDLFIERFFQRHEATLSVQQADALTALMELADNDLLDLMLARKSPEAELDRPDVHALLALMRQPPSA